MKSEKNIILDPSDKFMAGVNNMKKESIFTVTFTDGGEVFISARDEAHARRIVDGQSWQRNVEEKPFSRTIEKVEKVNG